MTQAELDLASYSEKYYVDNYYFSCTCTLIASCIHSLQELGATFLNNTSATFSHSELVALCTILHVTVASIVVCIIHY